MSRTTLSEVADSEFKVITLVCKQEVDIWEFGGPAEGDTTEAFRGKYKLQLPQGWDVNRPTYLAVESVDIYGIPIGTDDENGQVPWQFELRSDALTGEGVYEAKRWRGPISHGHPGGGYNEMGSAYPYTTTAGGEEVEVSPSNLLQKIPNTVVLDWQYDWAYANTLANIDTADVEGLAISNYSTDDWYKLHWSKPVDFTSLGHKLTLNSAQTMIDLYISAGGDIGGQYPAGYLPDGEDYEHRLRLKAFPGPPDKTGPQRDNTGMNGGYWCAVLKIFQPALPK